MKLDSGWQVGGGLNSSYKIHFRKENKQMKYDRIKYLKGTRELLRLADEEYEKLITYQSFDGFYRPEKFENRYRKSRFKDENYRFEQRKFSAIKKWSDVN